MPIVTKVRISVTSPDSENFYSIELDARDLVDTIERAIRKTERDTANGHFSIKVACAHLLEGQEPRGHHRCKRKVEFSFRLRDIVPPILW